MASYGGSTGKKTFIDPTILTKNVTVDEIEQTVSGEGLFDVLMDTATKHLRAQFDANRIREEDYAAAYVDIYKATLTAALQAWDTSLKDEEKEAQIALIEAQTALVKEQTETQKCETKAKCITAEALIPAQVDKLEQDIKTSAAQEAVYKRQVEGFDENYKEKILKICLDAWGVGFSVSSDAFYAASTTDVNKMIPRAMTASTLNALWDKYVAKDLDVATDNNDNWSNT